MEIKCLENYYTSENTYVVVNGGSAFVIDPSYNTEDIIKAADGAKITHILLTHCHYDHIGTLNELRELTGAVLVTGKYCSINIGDPIINLSGAHDMDDIVCKPADSVVSDGEIFDAAGVSLQAIYTPGHTNCSVCYKTDKEIFTGDTLFLRSVGRSDLPTGDGQLLISSIKNKLYTLDDELTVYPGHGGTSSIGYEKKFNFYVRAE